MKARPVRICDISRELRISSSSLISFLQEKGYSVIGEFRSPLSSKMVELIQNGYNEGPPFTELNSFIPKAEEWEKQNDELVSKLHSPPPKPQKKVEEEEYKPRRRRVRKPKLQWRISPSATVYTGRITLTPLDLELIHQMLALDEPDKIKVRDYLRRKTILKALSHLE